MRTEGHDMGKPEGVPAHPDPKTDREHPGYEVQDVNVSGVVYFLGGLLVSVAVFFILCFYIGKVVNYSFAKEDGPQNKWHGEQLVGGQSTPASMRENLASNPDMYQRELKLVASSFPTPQLETDDGLQGTADLHAREDLLLDFYSTNNEGGQTTTRIPIDRAMQLIAQRGLGAAPAPAAAPKLMVGDSTPQVTAPLTSGFARTGYELDTIETREQRKLFGNATKPKE
jgi:hypothetical protein